jgi:hypothetical protein
VNSGGCPRPTRATGRCRSGRRPPAASARHARRRRRSPAPRTAPPAGGRASRRSADGVAGVLPALVRQPRAGLVDVLEQVVAVRVAVLDHPGERPLERRQQRLHLVGRGPTATRRAASGPTAGWRRWCRSRPGAGAGRRSPGGRRPARRRRRGPRAGSCRAARRSPGRPWTPAGPPAPAASRRPPRWSRAGACGPPRGCPARTG